MFSFAGKRVNQIAQHFPGIENSALTKRKSIQISPFAKCKVAKKQKTKKKTRIYSRLMNEGHNDLVISQRQS
jgi:hypothetical protein